jgi:lipoprotein signal peptidase
MTDFLNVPSFNVGNGPVVFNNLTSAPGAPPASLNGTSSLGAIVARKNTGATLSKMTGNEKLVLLLGTVTSVGGLYAAYKSKKHRRKMSAIGFSAFPLAVLYAGLN